MTRFTVEIFDEKHGWRDQCEPLQSLEAAQEYAKKASVFFNGSTFRVLNLENNLTECEYFNGQINGKLPIQVWQYEDCPQKYKDQIKDPSDLDWVIFVPNSYYYESGGKREPIWLGFLDTNWREPTEILLEDQSKLLLMYHSLGSLILGR